MDFNKYFITKNTKNIIDNPNENPHLPSIPGLNKYYLNSDNIFYKENNIVINFDDISNGFKKGKFFSNENIYEENIFHSEIYFDYNFKDEELNISPKINNPFSIKAFEINNFLFEKNTKREFSF